MDTSAQLDTLQAAAAHVARNAHAPYSKFFVGAAILLTTGETITGCNVENSSFRLTTCAEQNAIAHAVALLGPHIRIAAVAVQNLNQSACQPCGACRQTIAEFAEKNCLIRYPGQSGPVTCTLADILPSTFHLPTP